MCLIKSNPYCLKSLYISFTCYALCHLFTLIIKLLVPFPVRKNTYIKGFKKIYKTLTSNSDELLSCTCADFRFDVCTFSIVAVQMGRVIHLYLSGSLCTVSIILSAEAESTPSRQVNTQHPESAFCTALHASIAFSHSLAKCSTRQDLSGWSLLIIVNLLCFFDVFLSVLLIGACDLNF